ncbi:PH domain containing protein [Cordyceps fumosorosea ARSEF 2679]|uniref:PH domain containing protein n=1 Tax=Cordyceps fumosorosea (strain ARSEF 2679) TaxID=1081104 RepID=A0A162N0Q7_CORFA|nr:PH domain containing protein [Cordyceps fumosorosea ARSEF 2679]OAA73659.1 PH domain containing protein [Cordyceps fumosorosea ARSEF 2679]
MDAGVSHQLHHPPDHQLNNHHPRTSYLDHESQPTPNDYGANAADLNNNHYLTPSGRFTEEWDASQRGSSIIDGHRPTQSNKLAMQRTASISSYAAGDDVNLPNRNNTLRKKPSMRRTGSLSRSASRRSNRAGSVRSLALHSSSDRDESHSAFYCPVPTSGNPTTILAERFQTWRKFLKDLISYFREIQSHYEQRAKSLTKLGNAVNNVPTPDSFLKSAGIDDALQLLRSYNKTAVQEAQKAKEIEEDVILALTGLRSDLQQKIKEIKQLSGDFKNSVDKEMNATTKAVSALADVLDKNEVDASSTTGRQDPFLLRLAVDRQVERQIDEENYLHQAYHNLEGSGRELESIVVGEIQKAYNAYAGILKREADNALNVVGELRDGPIAMPKDQEWIHFVTHEDQVVDPTVPLRSPDQIHYPGQDHLSAQEIRAGLLERKSKYLKSYTAGWYVLSSTHLHEFKSADKNQAPVMSLYLPEQKVGSHSEDGSSSNKFVLKGRQTGGMHRGHTWVFRAESYDTMLAWYEDIKALTEKSPEERQQFVRTHSRSLSRSSRRSARSVSSDGLDDEDEEPFTGGEVDTNPTARADAAPRRPEPGGRFPSDLQVMTQSGLHAPLSPSSLSSGAQEYPSDAHVIAAAGALPGSHTSHDGAYQDNYGYGGGSGYTPMDEVSSQAAIAHQQAQYDGVNPYTSEPVQQREAEGGDLGVGHGAVPVVVADTRVNGDGQVPHEQATPEAAVAADSHGVINNKPDTTTDVSDEQVKSISAAAAAAAIVDSDAVPSSETPAAIPNKALQAVPEAEAADHITPLETPMTEDVPKPSNRPQDHRTDSMLTISNLDIPGRFPKGGSTADGSAANVAA